MFSMGKRWTLMSWLLVTIADAQSSTASAKNTRLNKEKNRISAGFHNIQVPNKTTYQTHQYISNFSIYYYRLSYSLGFTEQNGRLFFFSCYKFIIRLICSTPIFWPCFCSFILLLTKMDDVWLSLLALTFYYSHLSFFKEGTKSRV